MKKQLAIALTVLLLTGCGANPASETQATPASEPAQVTSAVVTTATPTPTPTATPAPTATPTATPAPTATPKPEPSAEPTSTPAPTAAPTAAPAKQTTVTYAAGDLPLNLSAGSDKWWAIDSTDSAYTATLDNINAMRAEGGLAALTMDSGLSAAASARCEDFVAGGAFDHSGMTTRSEICAKGPLFSASAVCEGWKGSPAHYANIMEGSFTKMGVGCWFCTIDGSSYAYWCVTFE